MQSMTSRLLSMCAGVALLAATTGAASADEADWPNYHHTADHDGVAAAGSSFSDVQPTWTTSGLDGAVYAEPLYVGGVSRLAAEHDAFVETSTARLLELLEQHVVLASMLRELLGPGLIVRIGSENVRSDLRECSLVLAPYLVEGEVAGTVGVLGPTRMDYRKAQAAVAAVSQQLGRQLSR